MGHSSVMVTLDRYGHLFDGLDERIAEGLEIMWHDAVAASPRPGRGLDTVTTGPVGHKTAGERGWALRDSNPRPSPCKGGALAS